LETSADIDSLTQATGFHPTTSIEQGMERFAAWFRAYHHL
jgi:UDP-glucuronate 4-epimerase